jgi:hypothetical protein
MEASKGGRGHKAPYATTHVRVPVPMKAFVEKYINKFREEVETGQIIIEDGFIYSQPKLVKSVEEWMLVLNTIDEFIAEFGFEENLHTRNNVNLVKFRKWVKEKTR